LDEVDRGGSPCDLDVEGTSQFRRWLFEEVGDDQLSLDDCLVSVRIRIADARGAGGVVQRGAALAVPPDAVGGQSDQEA